ncbi:MAG TPA: hypothetical protein VKH19_12050 [Gemmatimonadaceae bacterium]|nr:hypothetical protein [Gemmatimonadaceae bacterium]
MTETGVASRAGMAARALLARTYWRLRLYADRSLHWRRHARATNAVKSRPRPRTILVVCHGNICRSPYLAAVLRRALRDVQIVSAGFVGPGRPVPEHSLAIGQRKGLDLAAHRSQLLTPEQLKRADLVLVMDSRQAWQVQRLGCDVDRVLIAADLDPMPGRRIITDPWGKSLDVFEASFKRLDRAANHFASVLPRPKLSRTLS